MPLIRHVDHGLAILGHLGQAEAVLRAYCLHPLLQPDDALATHGRRLGELTDDPWVVALALEYRHIANATLSTRVIARAEDIPLSPLAEVNQMLVADKVQNRHDFLIHHRATHPRSDDLDRYFRLWLQRLGVDEARFAELRGLSLTADACP